MVEMTAATFLVAGFAVFQVLLGIELVRAWVKPLHFLLGALFIMNGAASIGLVRQSLEAHSPSFYTGPWINRLLAPFDDPTGWVLLMVLVAYGSHRHVKAWSAMWSGVAASVLIGLLFLSLAAQVFYSREASWYRLFMELPLPIAYAGLLLMLARAMAVSSDERHSRFTFLLLLGLGARAAQFSTQFSLQPIDIIVADPSRSITTLTSYVQPVGFAIVLVATFAAWWLLLQPARRQRGAARDGQLKLYGAIGLLGAALMGVVLRIKGDLSTDFGWYLMMGVTLFAVRPLLVGLALVPDRMSALLATSFVPMASYAACKALVSALTGDPFWRLGWADFAAVPLALLLFTMVVAWRPGWFGLGRSIMEPRQRDRFVAALRHASGEWVLGRDLAAETGIDPRNFARIIASLHEEGHSQIETRLVGIRGLKQFRLALAPAK